MYTVTKIKWNQPHQKWSTFNLGPLYQQYLLDTYGITVQNGRVIWKHVLEVVIVPAGGAPGDTGLAGPEKKKKRRKKIKLIFIMGDLREEETKVVNEEASVKMIKDVQNLIEQQLQTKITLSDVQIIKG